MLGKVFKHEMKSTSRLFLPLMIGFIAITLLCKFTFETSYSAILGNNRLMETITVIFFVLYFIYIIALFVMTSVFIVMHFYKTMVSDQGYLTNTLPVKMSTLINAKLLSAVLWEIIAGVLFILSIFIFFTGHLNFKLTDLQQLLRDFGNLYREASNYLNMPIFLIEVTIYLHCRSDFRTSDAVCGDRAWSLVPETQSPLGYNLLLCYLCGNADYQQRVFLHMRLLLSSYQQFGVRRSDG